MPRRRGLDTFSAQKCGAYAVRSASDCRHRAESVRVRIGTTYLRGSPQNPNEEEEEERKRERERQREKRRRRRRFCNVANQRSTPVSIADSRD